MTLTVGSLFAGIGGFDLAAERAGMEVLWQSELDKHASRVLDYHWPNVKNYGDIHDITDRTVPRVDVLCGGFPCQDWSVAGTGGGLAGDRGALWWQYHRLATELCPTWIVGENVPGLLSADGGRDFETIVGSLTECGYGVAWAVLDAQYFGVAQRRRRVFIVGHSGGQPRPEVLALSEGVFGHPEPGRSSGEGVAATLETRAPEGRHRYEENHLIAFEDDRRTGLRLHDGVAPTLQAMMGSGGNNQPTLPAGQTLAVAIQGDGGTSLGANGDGFSDDGVGYTLNVTDRHSVALPHIVRRLTPLECERLQGFPDGWTDVPGNSDSQRYRQLGNAVAVPVVEWIMRRLAG